MAIGIDDDLDSIQEDDVEQQVNEEAPQDTSEDAISMLLKERGIEDKDRIKFENEEGNIDEVSWDNLSEGDKYNILKTSERNDNTSLDDSEIQLINTIRSSQLTPEEYLQYVGNNSVNNYVQSLQAQQPMVHYIDQYSDDELYVMDLLSKVEDITEQEALEALNNAKSNESLLKSRQILLEMIIVELKMNLYKTLKCDKIKSKKKDSLILRIPQQIKSIILMNFMDMILI